MAVKPKWLVTPLVYKGKSYHDYGIDKTTGDVVSKKRGYWEVRKSNVSGGCLYPKLNISLGTTDSIKTIMVHKAVCETLFDYPIPIGITEKDWKITPKSVKNMVYGSMQVNHIDHDHNNYHPSNLEWNSLDENIRNYHEYRTTQ